MSARKLAWTLLLALCALFCLATGTVGAYATIAPPPSPSPSSGLPDGRVYEQVSPANKHGYSAGALGPSAESKGELAGQVYFTMSSLDGNAVAYGSNGPAADVNASGLNTTFVAERTLHGWVSRSTMARGVGQNEKLSLLAETPQWFEYTPDLSHLVYSTIGHELAEAPDLASGNFYELGSDPLEAPTWLLREGEAKALEAQVDTELVGISPDAGIVYIAYTGSLLPQDGSRSGPGLYEYRNGRLTEAGVLPDGSVPASGAAPPATSAGYKSTRFGENNPASDDNQVSEDGRRVLFVSSGELYVHETEPDGGERTLLVSESQLPGHDGEPAPDGVERFENTTRNAREIASEKKQEESRPTFAYASPDGSHVFFVSADQLTAAAPPSSEPKTYDFDVDAGALEYLPGVTLGGIVTAAKDGSSFAFVNASSSPRELDLWSAGPDGGSVTPIAQLPGGGFVGPGRLVANDSVLVFQAQAPIAGFNNGGGYEQVYRYDIPNDELGCVSCPPAGTKPSGDASLSVVDQYEDLFGESFSENKSVNDARGVSEDGERIFFNSPDPLVGRDTNGQFDAYEWENGEVFLISSGSSLTYSLFLDNSPSGNDAFFTTGQGLIPSDDDTAYDVYDARIPRPGDNPPPEALPCVGDVCQGPPSVAELLGAPSSATFSGLGNLVSESGGSTSAAPKTKAKPLSRAQKLAAALKVCHKKASKAKRRACEKSARKRYRASGASVHHNGRRGK